MFEIVIFGVLFFLGARMVLDRDEAPTPAPGPAPAPTPGPSPAPAPGPAPQPNVAPMPTTPSGWPSSSPSYARCEELMAKLPKEQVSSMMTGALSQTDAQWATSMATMKSMGQGELAGCLDGARTVMKQIDLKGTYKF